MQLKEIQATFDRHCKSELYTLKFQLLNHLLGGFKGFGNQEKLEGSPFERFNVYTKRA